MGEFKPLLSLRGKTVIENTVESVLQGGAETVAVVTGYRAAEAEAALSRFGSRVRFVRNPDYAQTDMLGSIRLGVRALPPCGAFFLLPGDMPVVSRSTFERLREAWQAERAGVVFPTVDGRRKHPPLVDARMIPAIAAFRGEGGLRELWKQHESEIVTVPVDDRGVGLDLDTPVDYQQCREAYERRRR